MAKSNVIRALEELNKKDAYSLLMVILFYARKDPRYSTLSELSYILDNENFIKFLNYFGGQTITVPTIQELSSVLNAFTLYVEQQDSDKPLPEMMKELDIPISERNAVLEFLQLIPELINTYEFKRDIK